MNDNMQSGKLEVPLVVLESEIELHLNSAQASLDTMQVKYARKGLLSAGIVTSYAKPALTYAKFIDGKERERFQQYMELATRLINAYWEDFGLTLLKSAHIEEPVAVRVQPKPEPTKAHQIVKAHNRGRKHTDDATYNELVAMLKGGVPDTYERKADFFRDVAQAYKYTWRSVEQLYYKIQAQAKANGH